MLGSSSVLVNGEIERVIDIRLLGMSVISCGLCVCHETKLLCVYPLFLLASAKCTFFCGFYVFVGVGGAGCVLCLW